MRTLILNTTNLVQDGNNNKLVYNFPNSVKFTDSYVALSSLQMFYSWNNISTALGNTVLQYVWYDAAGTGTTYTINIAPGIYEISTLNQLLQYEFIKNGHYLVNAVGDYVYYAQFTLNPSRYAVQINTYMFPLALPSGYTNPAAIPFPRTVLSNPQIILPANINQIFGYSAGFTTSNNLNNTIGNVPTTLYQEKNQTTGTISYLSTVSPNVQPNSSLLLNLSNVDNAYSSPTGIIYTIVPSVGIGEVINEKPPQFIWNKLIQGTYNQITLNILGSNNSPIAISDPSMTFVLVIGEKSELSW